MKYILFGIKYIFNYWFSDRNKPLICGLVLHNKCNLRCRHCTIFARPEANMKFGETLDIIDKFYADGGRCLYLEGGEPLLWKDRAHTLNDVIDYAHKKGYCTVVVYTNGTLPLISHAIRFLSALTD